MQTKKRIALFLPLILAVFVVVSLSHRPAFQKNRPAKSVSVASVRKEYGSMAVPSVVYTNAAGTAVIANKTWPLGSGNDASGNPWYGPNGTVYLRWNISQNRWVFDGVVPGNPSAEPAGSCYYIAPASATLALGPASATQYTIGNGSSPAPTVSTTAPAGTTARRRPAQWI